MLQYAKCFSLRNKNKRRVAQVPNGINSKLYYGEVTFSDWLLGFARDFITREYDAEELLPEEFKPNPYYVERLAEARNRVDEVLAWSEVMAELEAQVSYEIELDKWEQHQTELRARLDRYTAMMSKIESWEPPTEEHQALKEFAIRQLREGLDNDFYTDDKPQKLTGEEFRRQELRVALNKSRVFEDELESERQNAERNTDWAKKLRASLA
jgi:hypothetical protein